MTTERIMEDCGEQWCAKKLQKQKPTTKTAQNKWKHNLPKSSPEDRASE